MYEEGEEVTATILLGIFLFISWIELSSSRIKREEERVYKKTVDDVNFGRKK